MRLNRYCQGAETAVFNNEGDGAAAGEGRGGSRRRSGAVSGSGKRLTQGGNGRVPGKKGSASANSRGCLGRDLGRRAEPACGMPEVRESEQTD